MNQDKQTRNLMPQIETKNNDLEHLDALIEKLKNNEIVKKYISLIEQHSNLNSSIYPADSKIKKIEKDECSNDHKILFCISQSRIDYKGRSYYHCQCLNCRVHVKVETASMEACRIIDGRKYIRGKKFLVYNILNQATKKYHLLRECYYKYPEILKETDNKDKMIYKVMRKKYEINNS